MIAVDLGLARRLEAADALNGVACAQAHQQLNPGTGAAVLEIAGGFAIFVGVASPLTHAIGLGMRDVPRAAEIDRMEEFYQTRGATPSVELCPLADATFIGALHDRGYTAMETNSVLIRPLAGSEFPPSNIVRLAHPGEEYLWARTVGLGFLEKDELTPEEIAIGSAIWHMAGSRCYLAFDRDRAAAAAAMTVHQGLATFFADSTMLGFRGAGLHGALIRERLRVARAEGCDLATAAALPGSISQRNYERNGFQVAYTKKTLVRYRQIRNGASFTPSG